MLEDDEETQMDFDEIDDMAFEDDEDDFYEEDEFEIYEAEEEERVYAIRPNKTQIKQEIAAIAEFAEQIVSLTATQLVALEFPESLHYAITQAAVMPHKGARKRQLKFITAALRKLDLVEIKEKIARLTSKSVHSVREQHQAERWREQLLSEAGHEALTTLLDTYPSADSQYIRQLQRNAKKELAAQKPPKSARLLYKYVKSLLENDNAVETDFSEFTDALAE